MAFNYCTRDISLRKTMLLSHFPSGDQTNKDAFVKEGPLNTPECRTGLCNNSQVRIADVGSETSKLIVQFRQRLCNATILHVADSRRKYHRQ